MGFGVKKEKGGFGTALWGHLGQIKWDLGEKMGIWGKKGGFRAKKWDLG